MVKRLSEDTQIQRILGGLSDDAEIRIRDISTREGGVFWDFVCQYLTVEEFERKLGDCMVEDIDEVVIEDEGRDVYKIEVWSSEGYVETIEIEIQRWL